MCDDVSTCNKCNAPYQLVQGKECQLCKEGTYYYEDDESCESISFNYKWLIAVKECDDENCALCIEDGATCKFCLNGFTMNDLNECEPISKPNYTASGACNYYEILWINSLI